MTAIRIRREKKLDVRKTGWIALYCLCLFALVPENHAAPMTKPQVSFDLGNNMGDAWNQSHHLAKALQSYPHASQFRMTWDWGFGSISAEGVIVYNRQTHALRLRTTGGYSDGDTSKRPSLVNNYLYTHVTDAKLLQLAKDELGVDAYSGCFERLPKYGCQRHKIEHAYWF